MLKIDGKKYRAATMFEAIEFMATRKMVGKNDEHPEIEFAVFNDGSEVGCESKWSGPYSRLTPDIDAYPPVFWIYEQGSQK